MGKCKDCKNPRLAKNPSTHKREYICDKHSLVLVIDKDGCDDYFEPKEEAKSFIIEAENEFSKSMTEGNYFINKWQKDIAEKRKKHYEGKQWPTSGIFNPSDVKDMEFESDNLTCKNCSFFLFGDTPCQGIQAIVRSKSVTCSMFNEKSPKGFNWIDLNEWNNLKNPEYMYSERPPIGLRPTFIWLEERLEEIEEAKIRFKDAGKEPPAEWQNEQNFIISLENIVKNGFH